MSGIQISIFVSAGTCSKGHKNGISTWSEGHERYLVFHNKSPTPIPALAFAPGMSSANTVPGYEINTSCIKAIKSIYNARKGSKATRMRGDELISCS